MRLRMSANIVTVVFTWVLWEKWLMGPPGEPSQHRKIEAVSEHSSLQECQGALERTTRKRIARFKDIQRGKETNYQLLEGESQTLLADKVENTISQYIYFCLPPTIDPYRNPD